MISFADFPTISATFLAANGQTSSLRFFSLILIVEKGNQLNTRCDNR
jgi:hypothetical protein